MIVGKVVGSVVSTRKNEKLIGNKFMIVEPVHHMKGDLSQNMYWWHKEARQELAAA